MRSDAGDKRAKKLLDAIDDPTSFFATTQLYITFIAFFSGAYAASSFTDPLVANILGLGIPVSKAVVEPVVFIFITSLLTYFSLIFGELIPKRLALRNSLSFALATIGFLNILSKIALPFVKLLSISANFILGIFGLKIKSSDEEGITKEEIREMVMAGSESGSIAEREHDMLSNVLKLKERTVTDACVHRLDVVALPVESSFDDIVDVLANKKYSRIPIYEESIDKIIGILHMKDMMKYMVDNHDRSAFDIRVLLREPYFVPAIKKTDELLREMQESHQHMAGIIDEYGGMMGIVTAEDLIEEIVGSIKDEYDADEPQEILQIDANTYIIQGMTGLEKVRNHFGVDLPTDEYDTLNGFLIGQMGRIPIDGEKPELEYNGLLFKGKNVQEKRIATVTVSILPGEEVES
jgi:putative hemolysin